MNNPGLYNLGDVSVAAINAATLATVVTSGTNASGTAIAYVDRLEGMLSATLQVNFNAGAGGTTVKVMFDTSLDQGASWVEVVRLALATSNEVNVVNLSALTPVTTVYTPAPLSDDSVKDGILGPWFRARILTTGTYTGSPSLALRLIAR